MGLPAKLLGADEQVVLHTRTHAKALVLPGAAFVLVGAGVGAGAALIPSSARPVGQLAIVAVGVLLAIWWCLVPFLRWRTTTYTLTTRRLVTRSGILNKRSHGLPLSRVNDVSSERGLTDRMLGCGTLVVQTAAEGGSIVLVDVPEVELVHHTMTELLLGVPEASWPERSWPEDPRPYEGWRQDGRG
ncbi:PH domain-containing protein [uncultured Friedmanniella sp.]|uniref:PH domain-containing protein n=1 Tax=uncultured Friedmanniella sp. TaxID=335381 RepID=UPI0035CAE829